MPRATVEKPRPFYPVYDRRFPGAQSTHYCPGCGHGLVAKYLAEAIEELGVQDRTILVSSVGCSVFSYYYLDVGNVQASHGRAPAVATGIKRARPAAVVAAIQGDGDLAAIGLAEIVHAANRGEPVTILFVNNAIYGMTGGQMAPTTLPGQRTTTTPLGRSSVQHGHPLRICEILDTLSGPARIERVALGDPKQCVAARRALREALRWQVEGRGFSFLEILSPCPVGWKMEPVEARRHVRDVMAREFPLRLFRERPAEALPGRIQVGAEDARCLALGKAAEPPAAEPPLPRMGQPPEPSFKLAGFGGQGVLSAGLILAEAGRRAGYHVSWLPSYGPEMRGGTAHCHVRLARGPVGSPIVDSPDVLVAMSSPSLTRFGPQVRPGGLLVANASLLRDPAPRREDRIAESPQGSEAEAARRRDVEWLPVMAAEEAELAGERRSASIVALAAAVARTGCLPRSALEAAVAAAFSDPLKLEPNLRALAAGWSVGSSAASVAETSSSALVSSSRASSSPRAERLPVV